MTVRRRARIAVLQALFEIDLTTHAPGNVLSERLAELELPAAGNEFAQQLLAGVLAYRPSLDQIISRHAPEWPVDQLAVIDRNVLRMALYELAADSDIPVKVAINEAIELAKLFGSDASPRFVNGVLGAAIAQGERLTLPDLPAGPHPEATAGPSTS